MREITIKSVIILVAISFVCIGLTSCSKIPRVGELSGYYSTPEESTYYYLSATKKVPVSMRTGVLYFYNSNTVIKYFNVMNRNLGDYSNELVSGWYYEGKNNAKTYTYTMVDNKVVLTNGEIFTVGEGGEFLIKDGDSVSNQLKKWNP